MKLKKSQQQKWGLAWDHFLTDCKGEYYILCKLLKIFFKQAYADFGTMACLNVLFFILMCQFVS